MVSGAGCDDAARALVGCQMRDPVVRAPQLIAEDRLQVFTLEQNAVAKAAREARRRVERGFLRDIVNAAGEDQPQHLVGRERAFVSPAAHRVMVTGWM